MGLKYLRDTALCEGLDAIVSRMMISPACWLPLRAALQPLQHIRFDGVQRGELAQLRGAEAIDEAPRLQGEAMLAGFYLNELMLRLAPRHDGVGALYAIYGETRARLALVDDLPLAWTLRRFERDLIEALGVGFAWDTDGDGRDIDPAARYVLDAEHGPRRLLGDVGRRESATGRALLDLAVDREPCAEDMPGLRRAMRALLLHFAKERADLFARRDEVGRAQ